MTCTYSVFVVFKKFFAVKVIEQDVKFSVPSITSLWSNCWMSKCFVYMQGTKNVETACRLFIAVTDFYVYVRNKYFCVYVHGRKKSEKTEDNLMEYLKQIDSCGYVRVIGFSACVKGRKEKILVNYNRHRFLCVL